jgi:hypothetical protein
MPCSDRGKAPASPRSAAGQFSPVLLLWMQTHIFAWMKKKECPSCAMEIPESSKTCPVCGFEFPVTNKSFVWIAVVLLLAFVLGLLGSVLHFF